ANDHAALVEAVKSAERAAGNEQDPMERSKALNMLGCALEARYWSAGRARDLDSARKHLREAAKFAEGQPEHEARCLSNLANVLRARYARDGRLTDLEEASRVARRAVDTMPTESPGYAWTIGNWASALRDLCRVERDVGGVDRAIAAFRKAQALLTSGHG